MGAVKMNVPIRDIKPNVEIVDIYFYLFLFFFTFVIVSLVILIYKFLTQKKPSVKQKAYEEIKNFDYTDSKKVAYSFKELAKPLINEENQNLYDEINKDLEAYKYKPNVPAISDEIKEKIENFLRLSNVS
jgi:hypothetical protein